MEKKLYRVKVELFVMAEDEADARSAATRARFDILECSARKAEYVSPEWDEAIPYNAEDERTCAEILGYKPQTVLPETGLMKMPAYVETAMRVFEQDNQSSQPGQSDQ